MPASVSIDALRRSILELRPGATIFGIRNAGPASGHNEDDTPGVQAEMQDSDTLREYRSIDVMIGPGFTAADAARLRDDLITEPANRARLLYVIYDRRIYRRTTGFASEPYDGSNPHTDHDHVSGHASDDANGAPWHLPRLGEGMNETELNAYVDKYAGGPGNTSPAQRAVRDDWRNLVGQPAVMGAVEALANAVAGLANQVAELAAKVDAIPAAQPAEHTHVVDTPTEPWSTSGPVPPEA